MIKGLVQQESITIPNICVPKTGVTNFIKQLLLDLRNEIDSNTIIVGDFNIQNHANTWKLNKRHLNDHWVNNEIKTKDL